MNAPNEETTAADAASTGRKSALSPSERRAAQLALARRAAHFTWLDLRWGAKSFVLNTIGGSSMVPRVLRVALLRAYGAEVRSTGIMAGGTYEGNTHNLHIGANCYFNNGVYIESVGEVRIGDGVAMGMEAMILTSAHELTEDGRWTPETTPKPVVVGDHVWIGARATVLPGVTIGEHTVIASGAVVTKDCEPWSLYGGVPAKRIRGLRDAHDARGGAA